MIEPFMPRDHPGPEWKDDRQIISSIPHVLTSGCRCRDCPAAYGLRTTVYNRLNRWSQCVFREAMLTALVRAEWVGDGPLSTAATSGLIGLPMVGKGARMRAIGPSRGGQPTKIHALTDCSCRPPAFLLTGGQVADCKAGALLLERLPTCRIVLADKGYDSDAIQRQIEAAGAAPNIPPKRL